MGERIQDGKRVNVCVRIIDNAACNKHIPLGASLNGEQLIVVRIVIVIVDYRHSLVRVGLNVIRPEGTKSNR